MVQTRPIHAGLLWHSVNSVNLGIGALTESHISILERAARDAGLDIRFTVIGWRDPEPAYISRPNLTVVGLRARDLVKPAGLFAAVRKCDLVLDISAGDSFADIYGVRRFTFNAFAKAVVLAARRPLVLAPQTIGPFERRWARLVARALMRRAQFVVTRDHMTTEFLGSMQLGEKLHEATDVAFCLPFDEPQMTDGAPVRIGINVSGLLYNGGYTKNDMFSLAADYRQLVGTLIEQFSGPDKQEVHLIGHVNSRRHEVEDDFRVCESLAARYPGTVLAPRFRTPVEAKSYIAGMDFFCGSRMHACIAAFSAGVPVLPIAYSRKFSGLFGSLDYDCVADCRTQFAAAIASAALAAFENRDALKSAVEEGRVRADRKIAAYEDLLRSVLAAQAAAS